MTVSTWLLGETQASSQVTQTHFSHLQQRIEELIQGMDFRKMASRRKLLLSVGFDPRKNAMNSSFYQTLASESRLSVLLMLAKRDLPMRAWSALSRITKHQPVGGPAALSWSGTLFEYLMPTIFIQEPKDSIMDKSARSAYLNQRAFLHAHGLRGALSESGHVDPNPRGAYGYKAFGIPTLASSPEVDAKLVVSPYAVALGLHVDPGQALADLRFLYAHVSGRYGFYEAMDYSTDPQGQLVGMYMSHHQGMLFASITNLLHDGFIQNLFTSHPLVQTVLHLIDEAVPSPTKELFSEKVAV
jgi:cyclic beta-1,2-glucan synthetase